MVSVDKNRLEYLFNFVDKYKYNKSQFNERTLKEALDELIYILEDLHAKNRGLYQSVISMTEDQRELMVRLEEVKKMADLYKLNYIKLKNQTMDRKLSWKERFLGKIKRGRFSA